MRNHRTTSKKRMLMAAGAGAAVLAVSLASAAGLGGLIVEQIGAESTVVADPFSEGVTVSWGDPVFDEATKEFVVSSFTASRNGGEALPIGYLRVTIADANGDALTEATATTTGATANHVFTLTTPIPVSEVGNVSIVLQSGTSGAMKYAVTSSQIGTAPDSVWVTPADSGVTIVEDPIAGEVLEFAGEDSGIFHDATSGGYTAIDNVYAARLAWSNFMSGATNGQIDPATGNALPTSGIASVVARAEAGSTLWFDVDIAYGATDDDLDVTRVTCQLAAGPEWTTIDLNDCSSIHDFDEFSQKWISVNEWTFLTDPGTPWEDSHTYAAGDHLRSFLPGVSAVAGYGFHVEGGGSAWIQGMDLRGQVIGFKS